MGFGATAKGGPVRRERIRKVVAVSLAAAAMGLAAASQAWSCASIAALEFSPARAKAGEEVAYKVVFVDKSTPVVVRWNALDGPILDTAGPEKMSEGLHGDWRFADGTFTVPADAKPGSYLIIASQDIKPGQTTWGMPVRGLLQVVAEGDTPPVLGAPAEPPTPTRPATILTASDGPGIGELVLVGLGAAGIVTFLAGMVFLAGGRRRSRAVPEQVR